MPSFETYESEVLAPGWLRDPAGAAYLGALGASKDREVARLKEAAKCDWPSVCPEDALALLAAERGLDRGPTETLDAFRERVRRAWDLWEWAGTAWGLLMAFYWAGYTPSSGRVVLQGQGDPVVGGTQFELRPDFDPAVHTPKDGIVYTARGNGSLGGAPAPLWSDFAVLFVSPLPGAWVPAPPADGSAEVNGIRSLLLKWKPAHARCVKLQATTAELWGFPTEDWGPTAELWEASGTTITWTPPEG
jgi:hypothetical protein